MADTLIVEILVTFEVPMPDEEEEYWSDAANRVLNRIIVTAGRDDVQEPEMIVHDMYAWENE